MRITAAVVTALVFELPAVLWAQRVAGNAPDGTVLEEQSYDLPYPTLDAWLTVIREDDPQFGREREIRMRRYFGPAYDRLKRGEVSITRMTYASDNNRVTGFLLYPRTGKGQRHPAVIYNRGGNRDFAALDMPELLVLTGLAADGYVVAASQYRGNDGGTGHEEFGGADVDDVLNLIPLLTTRRDVDSTRIGMVGWSRGGMMTYLALARTDRIAAAVVGSGVADLFATIHDRPDIETEVVAQLVPGYPATKDSALRARSAVLWPERLNKQTPILLLQGTADWRVDASQALHMAEALYRVRHPFRLVMFEGGDHGLTEYRTEVDGLVKEWLDTYVRDRKTWPSLEPHGD